MLFLRGKFTGEWICDPAVVRNECRPAAAGMVTMLMAHGWRVRRTGDRFRLHCPCGEISLPWRATSHDDVSHAARIVRQAAHCPARHDG